MQILLYLEVLQCLRIILRDFNYKSLKKFIVQLQLKFKLHCNENIPYGLVDQYYHLCPHSRLCGYQKDNFNKLEKPLSTKNVSEELLIITFNI